jgi:hypothetical protein
LYHARAIAATAVVVPADLKAYIARLPATSGKIQRQIMYLKAENNHDVPGG